MTTKAALREEIRQRAGFACEFCGVSETDAGGELTIDHFQPKAKGGEDHPDNLIYCCTCCNQYKGDYWPLLPDDVSLWNPRREPVAKHLLELDDGTLHPLTAIGAFTLNHLRLNRQALVQHRRRQRQIAEERRLLTRYRDLTRLIEQLLAQQSELMEEQQALLAEQRDLLRWLMDRDEIGER
jgi:hypothetical protein